MYSIRTFDNKKDCKTPSSFLALLQNHCFDVSSSSIRFAYPYMSVFTKKGCQTATKNGKDLLYKPLNTVCESSLIQGFDDEIESSYFDNADVTQTSLYEVWTNGVNAYTSPPSQTPGTYVRRKNEVCYCCCRMIN